MIRPLVAVAMLLLLVAAAPRASLPDVEDEVMCIQCGTALNVSTSAVADRQRAFIRERIAQGKTKDEIKADLVDEFGPAVLAVPDGSGFNVAAWLVPALLVAGGIVGVGVAARRWRRSAEGAGAVRATALTADEARRLDAELEAFDR